MKQWVDLNCDLGEGCTTDAAIMPFISSANIACGYHAGNEETIRKTLLLAKQFNVAAGAHPSYPDRANFGRKEMELPIQEIKSMVIAQIELVKKIAEENPDKIKQYRRNAYLKQKEKKKQKELKIKIMK